MRGKERKGRQWLLFGGSLSITIALLHVFIILVGARAYRFFGAGEEMAGWAEDGSVLPALITLGLAAVFTGWGVYAYSGAGAIPRLPLLRWALLGIAAVYVLRGLSLAPELYQLMRLPRSIPAQYLVFSFISLCAGLVHGVGIVLRWERLSPPKTVEKA